MTNRYDETLPALEEFELDNVAFKVVNPTLLPPQTYTAFDEFMDGSTVPHRVYVYAHDYTRFCMLVRKGHITIDDN